MKRIISLMLAVIVMACAPINAFAAAENPQPDASPNYSYTNGIMGAMGISNKVATCQSIASGISGTTTKIVVEQHLQYKSPVKGWTDVKSWTKTSNTVYITATNSTDVSLVGFYRLKTIFTVYAGSKYEVLTHYSTTVTLAPSLS